MDRHTELLKLLEKDCRATPDQLAAMLGRETAEVRSEIAELEKQEVILGYNAMIDWDRTGEELVTALIEVRVTPQRGDGFDRIAQRVYQFEEVESMYLMSGAYDFAVTITGRTLKDVASFVSAFIISRVNASGMSQWNERGMVVNCFWLVMGLMPGMMGTSMPSFLTRSTKSKNLLLSKNI